MWPVSHFQSSILKYYDVIIAVFRGLDESELSAHITKLHEYNEIKDIAQMLIGRIGELIIYSGLVYCFIVTAHLIFMYLSAIAKYNCANILWWTSPSADCLVSRVDF